MKLTFLTCIQKWPNDEFRSTLRLSVAKIANCLLLSRCFKLCMVSSIELLQLHFHAKFDDLYLISRSQFHQKGETASYRFLSKLPSLIKTFMLAFSGMLCKLDHENLHHDNLYQLYVFTSVSMIFDPFLFPQKNLKRKIYIYIYIPILNVSRLTIIFFCKHFYLFFIFHLQKQETGYIYIWSGDLILGLIIIGETYWHWQPQLGLNCYHHGPCGM